MRKWIYAQAGLGLAVTCAASYGLGLEGCSSTAVDPPKTDAGTTTPPTDGGGAGDGGGFTGPVSKNPNRGSAIALSEDESIVVMVNRDSDSISVFAITYAADGSTADAKKVGDDVKVGGEPWQVVIAPDNDTAYVVLRKDQKLVKVSGLKKAPTVGTSVAVGSEPTGVALTPTGQKAWVANWVDGTIMGIDTTDMKVGSTVDLNAALVKGMPSAYGTIAPRPSIAHPRSVAITNNGDKNDDDESVLVTEYFAQQAEPEQAAGGNADKARIGIVYKVKISDKSVSVVKLNPIADMGFKDSAGGQAGCFPNQLQSITISGKQAFVTSVCASPKGPTGVVTTATPPDVSNVKTTTHGAVSVFDIDSGNEVATGTASLHDKFDKLYTSKAAPDDGSRRYPIVPSDIGFVPGSAIGYVPANGSDAVFRVRYDDKGAFQEAGATNQNFINLTTPATEPNRGRLPIGVAVSSKKFMFVASDASRNLAIIDLNTQSIAGTVDAPKVYPAAALPTPGSAEEAVLKGKRFFNTGLGRWSLRGQGWGACQSCHVDGLTDNVTWHFARGPRQSTSLEGSFSKKDPKDQRIFNWTAIFDEIADFEGNTRGISGGVGAIVHTLPVPPAPAAATDRIDTGAATLPPGVSGPNQGLSGSSTDLADVQNPLGLDAPSKLKDWEEITKFIQKIRPPRGATNVDAAKVAAGKTLFAVDGACAGCHGGDKWTISKVFYTPSFIAGETNKTLAWTAPVGFPPALLPAANAANRFMRFGGANPAAFDQLQCILRPVGTFGVFDPLTGVSELRADMTTVGQGNEVDGKGFNPPSLLGVSVGGPYLHAGNAGSLEALFATTFQGHYAALAPNFLSETDATARAAKVSQLVHYLLSIDASTVVVGIPTPAGATGGDFCL